ncbi:MAG: glycosyltransferase [Devosia sp.]|nr:glycosyltransferase [Devosia sp.]
MDKSIALFLPSLQGGGAERVMVTLANAFAARGGSVDLVLVKADGIFLRDVSPEVHIVDLDAHGVIHCLPGLVRYLRRKRPHVLLSALKHANVAAIVARLLVGGTTRLAVSEHSTLSAAQASLSKATLRGKLLPLLMRFTYRHADAVIAVSSGVADDLSRAIALPRERVRVIFNPILADSLRSLSAEGLGPGIDFGGDVPLILAAGRLVPPKDFGTLLRAFARLLEKRSARLMILGEGPLRAELEALVDELNLGANVSMPGFASNPYALMRRANLFVLSSIYEGFGNVLVEAMAVGTPVVSTDCPSGPAEILENGKWGRLVPVGDVEGLARAMDDALDDPNPPDVASRAADFGVDRAVDDYLEVLGLNSNDIVPGHPVP